MRKLLKPYHDPNDVFALCINGISDPKLRANFSAASSDFESSNKEYDIKSQTAELYQIHPFNGGNDDIVSSGVTKKEFKKLYTDQMVPANKPGRKIYDEILVAANGRCPLCGVGHATTLDHYLPKSSYPIYSVFPANLVPACKDCNHAKLQATAVTAQNQSLHPYFDNNRFYTEKWLHAEVLKTSPISFRYYVCAPAHWDAISKCRVNAHFDYFKLGIKYSIEAAREISTYIAVVEEFLTKIGEIAIRDYIISVINAEHSPNTWKAAMYHALTQDI